VLCYEGRYAYSWRFQAVPVADFTRCLPCASVPRRLENIRMPQDAKKRLILHVGFHKTASTAIQEVLYENRQELEKRRIRVPEFTDPDGRKVRNHSRFIYSLFCEKPESYRINVLRGWDAPATNALYAAQLQAALAEDLTLVLSGEGISALPADRLAMLRDKCEEAGYEIEVLAFVRGPYSMLCSSIQEICKGGSVGLAQKNIQPRSEYAAALAATFANVRFFSFADACRHSGGPVGFFLEHAGVGDVDFDTSKTVNSGLGQQTVRLVNYINEHNPNVVNRQRNPDYVQYFPERIAFDDTRFLLTPTELERWAPWLTREIEVLGKATGLDFSHEAMPTWTPTQPTFAELKRLALVAVHEPQTVQKLIED
jgi:hypothetical protein